MRVATLNLWNTFGDWPARRRVLVEGFKALQADVVAFQEAVRTDAYDQAADLLGDGYDLFHQGRREADGSGIVLASRWPFGQVRELDLHLSPRTEGFACATLIAEVLAPEPLGRLLVANHFPSWQPRLERERLRERLFDQPVQGVWASDHFGLVADLSPDEVARSGRKTT